MKTVKPVISYRSQLNKAIWGNPDKYIHTGAHGFGCQNA